MLKRGKRPHLTDPNSDLEQTTSLRVSVTVRQYLSGARGVEIGACQRIQEPMLVIGCLLHIKEVSPAAWVPEAKDQNKQ